MFRLARIDRQFRRFLRTGDARALGVVFDATAPELFKIAAYLAGDRQQAEDLVQSTFLVALERRAEFDTSRSVMPWLCGIVTNLARAERRRARRQAPAVDATAEVDPAASADMTEFRAAFAHALDGLSTPYRSVLELHLEHGLCANEIARVLDRPAGTVRAQIARGLDLLRKRLPRGFVASVVVSAMAPSALSAMRAAVLAGAHATMALPALTNAALTKAAVTPWAAALIGVGIMNKKLLVAGVIGASLLALGIWLANGSDADSVPVPSAKTSAAPVTASITEEDDAVARSAEPIRAAMSASLANADIATGAGRIEVTVRWQGDGAAAARQSIEVVCAGEPLAEMRPRRALTDSGGFCVLEEIAAGAVRVFASTGHCEQVTVEAGKTAAVELELKSWGIVRGVVVDAHDGPVPDADVWVSSEIRYGPPGRGERPGRGQYGGFTMRTDAAGRFETRLCSPQSLSAAKRGYGPSPTIYPCSGNAPRNGIDVTLRLTAEGSTLIVEVRDALGAPVADAHVLVGPEVPYLLDQTNTRATPPPLRRNTDNHGMAELAPLPTGTLPVQVRAMGFAPWQGEHELPPSGTARLLVQLAAAATVHGVATDDAGAPVPHALVYHGSLAELRSSSCTTDAGGRFELRSLPVGKLELTAWKEDLGKCTTELVVESGVRYQWHPLLTMRPAITGVVLGVDEKPAVGAYVSCMNSRGGRERDSVTGKTDARGRFTMGPLQSDGSYSVTAEVLHARQGALRVSQHGVPPETELVLQVGSGVAHTARLRGRLLEADGTPATRVHMTVAPQGDGPGHDITGHYISVEQNGAFDTGPIEPGRIRIEVLRQGDTIADLGEHDLHPHQTVDLGDVYLPMPGGAVLRITGGDAGNGVANLYRDGQSMSSRRLEGQQVQWNTLPPGDYRVCVRRGGAKPLVGVGAFTVTGGSTARAEVHVQPAHRCQLRFFVDGICGRTGTLIAADASSREVLRDSMQRPPDGEALTVLLPEGRLRLMFRTDDGWTGEVHATIPTGAAIDIRLTK